MIVTLSIILLLLMVFIGGDRGAKSFVALALNLFSLIVGIYLIVLGSNPILIVILGCFIFCGITLIYQNGNNIKTYSAVISVILVSIILGIFILVIVNRANIGGYSELDLTSDLVVYLSSNININMNQLMICMVMIGLLGAIMDTAMSISSALFEINKVNTDVTLGKLIESGFNVGKDILGTTVNTLFFATVGETMMISILFIKYNYTFESIIKSKEFFQSVFILIISNIGCLLIIPITVFICSYMIKSDSNLVKVIKKHCEKFDE